MASDPSSPELAFGPIRSRRLGWSLGVNHVPPKQCTYSCVYCQLGPTPHRSAVVRPFHPPEVVVAEVARRVASLRKRGEPIDFLTLVPDGEPTLDQHLGTLVEGLKALDVPVAVISNATLLWRPEVQERLARADWVSVKVDAVDETAWRRVNRPHPDLDLTRILDGIAAFAKDFGGHLATETMLVRGINDDEADIERLGIFLEGLGAAESWLAVPTRPPAVTGVEGPDEAVVNRAYQQLTPHVRSLGLLTAPSDDAVGTTGDAEADLLGVTAVHPLSRPAVAALLRRTGGDPDLADRLVRAGRLHAVQWRGETFFLRPLGR